MTIAPAAFPRVDLRRIDTHPDFWYPLAWSEDLKPGKTLARRFAGEPIVLFRAASGNVAALEDRCAHRQVPLSLGVVQGDTLKCGYHGWAYSCAGKCIDVPYLGRERLPNGVRAYPAREVDGLIFVFPGNPALAEARAPTALGSKADAAYKTRQLNREVACHYTFMHGEPVRHEPSVPASQPDGHDQGDVPGPPPGRGLVRGRLHLHGHRRPPVAGRWPRSST